MAAGVRVHSEGAFEEEIVNSMLASGWLVGAASSYQPDFGLDPGPLFEFIGTSQMDAWNTLVGVRRRRPGRRATGLQALPGQGARRARHP